MKAANHTTRVSHRELVNILGSSYVNDNNVNDSQRGCLSHLYSFDWCYVKMHHNLETELPDTFGSLKSLLDVDTQIIQVFLPLKHTHII